MCEKKARELAIEFSLQNIERRSYTISQIKRLEGDDEVLVVGTNELIFYGRNNCELFFHPSLARIRITSMLKNSDDRLVKISGVVQGDSVLDCTMGLATDAIVFSHKVGITGSVTSVESEIIPYVLCREGLGTYVSGIEYLDNAMRRISVIKSNHSNYLKSLPDKSFDIVYFDPMFRKRMKSVALDALRDVANKDSVSIESITEAKRVARKRIVLKENVVGGEFEKLGFDSIFKKGGGVCYGVIDL